MKKIKYLYIPIGGIGSRLKKDKKELVYSSKCFLSFHGKTLLMRIIENCKDYCQEVVINYCTEEQFKDAYELLGRCVFDMKVQYKNVNQPDPYSGMEKDGDCLAYMGDSYIKKEHLEGFLNHVIKQPVLSFIRLNPKVANQKRTYYHYDGEYIDQLSYVEKQGYEHFEIGQLIYFPKKIIPKAIEICLESDPLNMLHTFIQSGIKTCCLELPCYNINSGEDYDLVSSII